MIPLVLCVDDDSITLMLCNMIMQKASFSKKTITATNGKDALSYFYEQRKLPVAEQSLPSLILLDLNMPVMDGWEFLELFNNDFADFHKSVKVVILSSSVNPEDKQRAHSYPLIIDFIPKPLSAVSLEKIKQLDEIKSFFQSAGV
ncbi:MAG: response regulator [Bacteroidota bacterium]